MIEVNGNSVTKGNIVVGSNNNIRTFNDESGKKNTISDNVLDNIIQKIDSFQKDLDCLKTDLQKGKVTSDLKFFDSFTKLLRDFMVSVTAGFLTK